MNILTIENKAAKLKLTEQVDKWSMDDLIGEVEKVYGAEALASGADFGEIMNCSDAAQNAADTLDIEIHSGGGSVLDGYRLYNKLLELRDRGVFVTANVSLAASMASVIAMAANKVHMRKGSRMMIHEASAATQGDAAAHRTRAELLEGISDEIAGIYSNRTGIPLEEIRESMKKETWLDGKQAVALKFADSFDTEPKEKTKDKKSMNILDRLTNPSAPESLSKIEMLENDIQSIQAEKAEMEATLSVAAAALQEVATEVTELKTVNASLVEKFDSLKAEHETLTLENVELKTVKEKVEDQVAIRAAELLSATGHPTPVLASSEDEQPSKTLFQQYQDLKKSDPAAAHKFWEENEAAIANGL